MLERLVQHAADDRIPGPLDGGRGFASATSFWVPIAVAVAVLGVLLALGVHFWTRRRRRALQVARGADDERARQP